MPFDPNGPSWYGFWKCIEPEVILVCFLAAAALSVMVFSVITLALLRLIEMLSGHKFVDDLLRELGKDGKSQ